jgi:CheY-like chemotaxis protein
VRMDVVLTERPPIAVAADNPIYRDILLDVLRSAGYYAVGLGVGERAIDAIRRASPGLVLIDVNVDGEAQAWALLERLHADPATVGTPAIVCSTHTYLSPSQAALVEQACARYLAKPFTLGMLLATVGAAIAVAADIEHEERN